MRGRLLEILHQRLLVGDSTSGAACWVFHIRGCLLGIPHQGLLVGYSTSGAACWVFHIRGRLLEISNEGPLVGDSITCLPLVRDSLSVVPSVLSLLYSVKRAAKAHLMHSEMCIVQCSVHMYSVW